MSTEKAKLICRDGQKVIEFMFNPKELSFQLSVETADNAGARSQRTGRPKVSFSNLPPKTITINNILFDTYETGKDVLEEHILAFQKATQFIEGKERPPVYSFLWGRTYLEYCFIESVNYKLTKFLANGTPVRAVIDSLTLKETERPDADSSRSKGAQEDPENDNMTMRRYKNA
jgi:hypothetical protein